MKADKYEKFLQKCAEEDPHNPRLNTEVIPVVFETHGAAGPAACRLFSMTRHQFGSLVLPCEDRSGEQTFYAAWVHRVSSALQRGTAAMIHHIAEGSRTTSRQADETRGDGAGRAECSGTIIHNNDARRPMCQPHGRHSRRVR